MGASSLGESGKSLKVALSPRFSSPDRVASRPRSTEKTPARQIRELRRTFGPLLALLACSCHTIVTRLTSHSTIRDNIRLINSTAGAVLIG